MEGSPDSEFHWNQLTLTDGAFEHIGSQIFEYFDLLELANYRQVCTSWRNFISKQSYFCRKVFARIKYQFRRKLSNSLVTHRYESGFKYIKANPALENQVVFADLILASETFNKYSIGEMSTGPVQDMYKIPILTSNLDHMNFVWECLDIRYGLFDTKRGFYQFAAKANVSGSGCPGSNFIQNFIMKKIKEGWLEAEKILFIAAHHNHRRVFQALWPLIEDKNPQLSLPQPSSTPLHIAAKHEYTKLVRDIINQDLDEKNPPDEVGMTPLHIAVEAGNSHMVEILFNVADDKNPAMTNGRTPLHIAAQFGDIDTIRLICPEVEDKNPSDMKQETPMHIAAENGYHEIIEIFLEILDNKNPPNANGWTPLHFAANRGHTECVRVILEETEIEDKNPSDDELVTPLHLAVGNDHFDVVKQIVDKIDDKHPKDCKGDSPFKVAEYQSNLEMLKFLEETCGIYDEESKESVIPVFEKSKKPRLE